MTHEPTLPTIDPEHLTTITGGSAAGIANSIGGLIDQFAGTGGQATEAAGRIGGLVDQFLGGGAG